MKSEMLHVVPRCRHTFPIWKCVMNLSHMIRLECDVSDDVDVYDEVDDEVVFPLTNRGIIVNPSGIGTPPKVLLCIPDDSPLRRCPTPRYRL